MAIKSAPIQQVVIGGDGKPSQWWTLWFTSIAKALGANPFQLQPYTVAQANALGATAYEGCAIYVSNEAGGATLAFSDGTNWRRVQDRAIIS